MAYNRINNVRISGISGCVPKKVVKNSEYEGFTDSEYKRFLDTVGVRERRIVDAEVCTSDLCFNAANELFNQTNTNPIDIKVLVFVSHTGDYKLPATACILQNRLGISSECMCFDVNLGCSGFPHGINILASLLSEQNQKGLLLIGNTQSKYTNPLDKSIYPLFADAGCAVLLEYNEKVPPMFFHFGTDGEGYKDIIVPDGGCRNPISQESLLMKNDGFGNYRSNIHEKMDGMNVFSFGVEKGVESATRIINHFEIEREKIDYLLLHQANLKMIRKINSKLNLSSYLPVNIDRFGNTSAASIPLLMVTDLKGKKINNNTFLAVGFGVGLSWGSIYFHLTECKICDLVEI
jgi:3-oxoacyl-[acyl-carrier-protein] synthase-3